jgi:hypothetical protein
MPCVNNDTAYDGVRMGLDSNNVLFKSYGVLRSHGLDIGLEVVMIFIVK